MTDELTVSSRCIKESELAAYITQDSMDLRHKTFQLGRAVESLHHRDVHHPSVNRIEGLHPPVSANLQERSTITLRSIALTLGSFAITRATSLVLRIVTAGYPAVWCFTSKWYCDCNACS